jgi:hypothetical protein
MMGPSTHHHQHHITTPMSGQVRSGHTAGHTACCSFAQAAGVKVAVWFPALLVRYGNETSFPIIMIIVIITE